MLRLAHPAYTKSGFEGGHPCQPSCLFIVQHFADLREMSAWMSLEDLTDKPPAVSDQVAVIRRQGGSEAYDLPLGGSVERTFRHRGP